MFAECIASDTRQTSTLPSAAKKTLGKIIALGKQTICRVFFFCTRQIRKFAECFFCTRQRNKFFKVHRNKFRKTRYGKEGRGGKKRFAECPQFGTRQTLLCRVSDLGHWAKLLYYNSRTPPLPHAQTHPAAAPPLPPSPSPSLPPSPDPSHQRPTGKKEALWHDPCGRTA